MWKRVLVQRRLPVERRSAVGFDSSYNRTGMLALSEKRADGQSRKSRIREDASMIALASRLVVLMSFALLAACGPEVKQPAPVGPRTDQTQQAQPAPASSPTTPSPTPTTASPTPSAPPPAVTSPPQPSPAPQEAPPRAPGEAPQRLIVKVGKANLREKPDNKSRILQVLSKGTKLVVIEKGNQWYRVRLDSGAQGWVAESVVTPTRPD
jgi:uncharacterized protein YgiM (DUF1202 family)